MAKGTSSVLLPAAGKADEIGTTAKSESGNAHHHVISSLGINAQGNAVRVCVSADKQSGNLYLTKYGARWLGVELLMRSSPDELKEDENFMRLFRMMKAAIEG